MRSLFIIVCTVAIATSCNRSKPGFDASGSFETEETIISSEASGVIKQFTLEEGQELKAGDLIGYIDSTQLYLKKKQLESQIKAGLSQRPDIAVQLATLEEQLKAAEREKQRFTNLLKDNATTQKQVDDLTSQVEVLKKQITAQRSALGITSESITEQTIPLEVQIAQINDQLLKCRIVNPVTGTVLSKYTEVNEMASPGKPLYKIADLSTIILRAYVTGNQLPKIKLNQIANISIDDGEGKTKAYKGTITWISSKAEFTPKTIQTKDERANLVYAIKVNVKNDGFLKIGMYGEVAF